jgi:hypothetical protein
MRVGGDGSAIGQKAFLEHLLSEEGRQGRLRPGGWGSAVFGRSLAKLERGPRIEAADADCKPCNFMPYMTSEVKARAQNREWRTCLVSRLLPALSDQPTHCAVVRLDVASLHLLNRCQGLRHILPPIRRQKYIRAATLKD